MAITLSGTIRGQGQAPLPAARLKLYGSRDDVGAVERAEWPSLDLVGWETSQQGLTQLRRVDEWGIHRWRIHASHQHPIDWRWRIGDRHVHNRHAVTGL